MKERSALPTHAPSSAHAVPMPRTFANDRGLTLVEVVLAAGILAFVLLTIAALQGSSLRVTADTSATREAVRLAENEIELQRIARTSTCSTTMPGGYTCEVTAVPCTSAGASIVCTSATDVATATSTVVRVTIVDVRGQSLTLSRWIP